MYVSVPLVIFFKQVLKNATPVNIPSFYVMYSKQNTYFLNAYIFFPYVSLHISEVYDIFFTYKHNNMV